MLTVVVEVVVEVVGCCHLRLPRCWDWRDDWRESWSRIDSGLVEWTSWNHRPDRKRTNDDVRVDWAGQTVVDHLRDRLDRHHADPKSQRGVEEALLLDRLAVVAVAMAFLPATWPVDEEEAAPRVVEEAVEEDYQSLLDGLATVARQSHPPLRQSHRLPTWRVVAAVESCWAVVTNS